MLHVMVRTDSMGKRKAWYLDTVCFRNEALCVVVFKNNNEDKNFSLIPIEKVSLDISFKHEASPVIESLRTINLELKRKQ